MDGYQQQYPEVPDQEEGPAQFSEEEIQNLKEIFDLFDKENQGSIISSDLDAIMQSLQRQPEEAQTMLSQMRQEAREAQAMEGAEPEEQQNEERVTFDEFITLMQQVENKLAKDDPNNLNRQEFL